MSSHTSHAVIIGGGIIGVASAWQLARHGYRVTILERREDVALETSFANGGQISPSEVAPWSKPETVRLAFGWMLRAGAPFRLHLAADTHQWRWLWNFLSRCTRRANEEGFQQLLSLASYSLAEIHRVRDTAQKEGWNLHYDASQTGILRIFRNRFALERERDSCACLGDWGMEMRVLTPDECLALEPALASNSENFRGGGLFTPQDESGDAYLFARALWENAKASGVQARFGVEVEALERNGSGRIVPRVRGEQLECDLVVLAAGCWSRELALGLGIPLPLWPVKGYSLTAEITDRSRAPKISITDEERRTVFTRLGSRIRVAGLAEVARSTNEGFDPGRARVLVRNLEHVFPDSFDPGTMRFWHGYRPMMSDSLPFIGRAPGCDGLWFNLGHGSLGWSFSMGSAALLTQLVHSEEPAIDPAPYDPQERLRLLRQ